LGWPIGLFEVIVMFFVQCKKVRFSIKKFH